MKLFGRHWGVKSSSADSFERALFWAFGGGPVAAGVTVTAETAMRCAAVFACIRVISESVGQLPLIVYKRLPNGGKERAVDHPLYRVLHDAPNEWQTSMEFREMLTGHAALRGNGYAFKNMIGGRVGELLPIHPDRVAVKQNADFEVRYTVTLASGGTKEYSRDEIFHVPGLSSNGYTGMSVVGAAREAIGIALATEKYGAHLFKNGAQPGGILSHPGQLSQPAKDRLRESFDNAYTGDNAFNTAVLEEGLQWTQLGMKAIDAQFLETRKFQRSEIASLFRVPLHMIGDLDRSTNNNIEQQSLEFVVHCLSSWVRRWEQRVNRDLFTPAESKIYFAEFMLDGLLRGDQASRYAAYAIGRQWGWLSANDVRRKENENPIENGDEYLNPMNMIPAGTPLGSYKPDATAKPPAKGAIQ